MVDSRAKGKRGELEAVAYLKELGFRDCERTAQRWGKGLSDVVCGSLPNVHIEIKFGYDEKALFVGSAVWRAAIKQASNDCEDKSWCVLWRCKGKHRWFLSFRSAEPDCVCTVGTDQGIARCLEWMNY